MSLRAVFMYGLNAAFRKRPPYVFRQLVLRNNLIFYANASNDLYAYGCSINSVENGLIEGNVVSLMTARPLHHLDSKRVRYGANIKPDGEPIPGYDRNSMQDEDSLATLVEGALILSL